MPSAVTMALGQPDVRLGPKPIWKTHMAPQICEWISLQERQRSPSRGGGNEKMKYESLELRTICIFRLMRSEVNLNLIYLSTYVSIHPPSHPLICITFRV